MSTTTGDIKPVIIGAGPAGLTAAFQLSKDGVCATVLEASDVVGGISQTAQRDGWRFDIGGHRFFTKVPAVEELWHEILDDDDFLLRSRMSRIYYDGDFYDYPLKASNALRNLGIIEAIMCVGSYAWARIHPPKDTTSFEGWTASRFGWRLYRTFFKTYTEKVWGVPASEIEADFAAQRIKNLSLSKAVINALMPKRNQKSVTSLIEEFQYPKLGPGMMWERCRDLVVEAGTTVEMETRAVAFEHADGKVQRVVSQHGGQRTEHASSHVVSSMPLPHLVQAMQPEAPEAVLAAARGLRFRDFLTVALVIPAEDGFDDNWIYVHSPDVHLGRIQNFGQWSPYMVKPPFTCLGLEYFLNEGDDLWEMTESELVDLGKSEMAAIGLLDPDRVEAGYVVRMPKAYPMYDATYKEHVETIRDWLETNASNVYPVGRNGMHRYNNQDHSMYTAMLSVENMFGANHDIWSVNVDEDYHEERQVEG